MEYFASVGPNLLINSPILVAWLVGIILSARMLKQEGGKAERLLLIGCCLMFAQKLLSPLQQLLTMWYVAQYNPEGGQIALFMGLAQVPFILLSMGGIVCLVFAFWFRWQGKRAPQDSPAAR